MPQQSPIMRTRLPVLRGTIDRRILVNYRIDPDVLAAVLPAPFTPKLLRGAGIGGICLIRLKHIRPRFLPRALGLCSENAAHRFAVQWERNGRLCEGVYVPRRDTSSHWNSALGGRLFPGVQHHARFEVRETDEEFAVRLDSDDGRVHLRVMARLSATLPPTSLFRSLPEASAFFEQGAIGYSATAVAGEFDGLELRTTEWRMQPLDVRSVDSSYFADGALFPAGTVEFDSAFLMRQIEHEWCEQPLLCAACT